MITVALQTIWKAIKGMGVVIGIVLGALTFAALLSLFIGCGDPEISLTKPIDDLKASYYEALTLEDLPLYGRGAKASVSIMMPTPLNANLFCSGFIFELTKTEAKVATNYHCFTLAAAPNITTAQFIDDICKKSRIFFSFNMSLSVAAECSHIDLKNQIADLAVFTIKPSPRGFPEGVSPITITSKPAFNEPAYMIHHPMEKGRLKDYGAGFLPMPMITKTGCAITGDYTPYHDSNADQETKDRLSVSVRHTCASNLGSSGAAIISKRTHEVIGLHWGKSERVMANKKSNTSTKILLAKGAVRPSCLLRLIRGLGQCHAPHLASGNQSKEEKNNES